MRRTLFALGFATAAVLAGCAVGPTYSPPSAPSGAVGPLVSVDPGRETRSEARDDWWRLYDDPALDTLVRQAFAANADLAAAQANLSLARASLEAARNGLNPQTNINLGARYGRDGLTDEILEIDGHKPQTTWLFDDILDVSYELDLFGHVRRSLEASDADAEAAAAARDSVKITVAAETIRAYAQVCSLGEQIAVAQRSADLTAREAEIANRRLSAGAGSDFDVVRAQLLAAQTRAAIPPLQGQRRAALFQLTALLGETPSQVPAEAQACTTAPSLAAPLPVGDGASLLKRRPDVRLADRRLAAATARIGVATADLYPRITLTGLYGGGAPNLGDLSRNAGLIWGVGPDINWSFPNLTGPRARVHAAQANAEVALANFDSAVLQALKETEQALSVYSAELDHHRALDDALSKARKALDMTHGQYLAGSISTLDLLTSERAAAVADASVAASDAALIQDQIAVFKALGGGWR